MSDIEKIRCTSCGRWIVKLRRATNGTAVPVEYRRPEHVRRGAAFNIVLPRSDIDREAVRREIAHERADGGKTLGTAEVLLHFGLVKDRDIDERVGYDHQFKCTNCGRLTVVPPAL